MKICNVCGKRCDKDKEASKTCNDCKAWYMAFLRKRPDSFSQIHK